MNHKLCPRSYLTPAKESFIQKHSSFQTVCPAYISWGPSLVLQNWAFLQYDMGIWIVKGKKHFFVRSSGWMGFTIWDWVQKCIFWMVEKDYIFLCLFGRWSVESEKAKWKWKWKKKLKSECEKEELKRESEKKKLKSEKKEIESENFTWVSTELCHQRSSLPPLLKPFIPSLGHLEKFWKCQWLSESLEGFSGRIVHKSHCFLMLGLGKLTFSSSSHFYHVFPTFSTSMSLPYAPYVTSPCHCLGS